MATEDNSFQSFESPADLKNVASMTDEIFNEISDQITVNATHFEIRVQSRFRNLTKKWLYVVKRAKQGEGERTGEEQENLTLVFSQKMSDFLAIEPPEGEEEE